MQKKIS